MLGELFLRIRFWMTADRLGPDVPINHWMLYFKGSMLSLCRKKFAYFDRTAEFRPGAYAVGCSNIHIGARVVIRPGSMLFADPDDKSARITIEDDVLIGSGVHIYVTTHRFDNPAIPIIDQGFYPAEGVVLRKGCWIGANATILPGVAVGRNAVIAAGSVVTKDIPDGVLAAGAPARVIREVGAPRSSKNGGITA